MGGWQTQSNLVDHMDYHTLPSVTVLNEKQQQLLYTN